MSTLSSITTPVKRERHLDKVAESYLRELHSELLEDAERQLQLIINLGRLLPGPHKPHRIHLSAHLRHFLRIVSESPHLARDQTWRKRMLGLLESILVAHDLGPLPRGLLGGHESCM